MKCPNCSSTEIPNRAHFCPNCGTSLKPTNKFRPVEKIIDYRDLISKITEGYIGRQWVREAVDDFLKAKMPRFFLLLGEPGCGKTAFMADLVKRRGYLHHFIGKGSRIGFAASLDWRNPVRFAESIGYQLLRDFGGWIMNWDDWGIHVDQKVLNLQGLLTGAEIDTFKAIRSVTDRPRLSVEQEIEEFGPTARVIGVYIDKFVMDVEQVVHQLLTSPLKAIATRWPEHQVVIVVDGLDEAEGYSDPQRNIFKMLPNGSLPGNIRFLLSSRPGTHLTNDFLSQAKVFWLSEDEAGKLDPHTIDDAKAFVQNLGHEQSIHAMLKSHEPSIEIDELAARVASASGGNFLYLYHYARALRGGDETLLNLETLPKGLFGIYEDFLSKIRERREDVSWDGAYKPVLGTLAVAQASMTRKQIAEFSRVKESTVGTMLVQVGQFLDTSQVEGEIRHAIYHSSFGEFLISDKNKDYIDGPEAHAKIVDRYRDKAGTWVDVDWSRVDDYGLFHLSAHLFALKESSAFEQSLYDLLCKPLQRQKFKRYGTHQPFAADVELAIKAARSKSPPNVEQAVRGSLLVASLRIFTAHFPPEMLGTLAELGQTETALAHATLLEDIQQRALALVLVAEALLRGGDGRRAGSVASESLAAASSIDLTSVDAGWGDPGSKESYSQLLQVLGVEERPKSQGGEAMEAVIRLLARVGSVLDASGELGRLPTAVADQWTLNWNIVVGLVAERMAQDGESAAALRLLELALPKAEQFPELVELDLARYRHAMGFAAAGAHGQALAVAIEIRTEMVRTQAFCQLALSLAEAGAVERALDAADSVDDSQLQGFAFNRIAWTRSLPANRETWQRMAHQLLELVEKSSTEVTDLLLPAAARSLAAGGNRARAESLMSRSENPWTQVAILTAIGDGCCVFGERDVGIEFATRALTAVRDLAGPGWLGRGIASDLTELVKFFGEISETQPIIVQKVADLLARTERCDDLLAAIETIEDPSIKDRAEATLPLIFASVGEVSLALETVDRKLSFNIDHFTLARVALMLAEKRMKQGAVAAAEASFEKAKSINFLTEPSRESYGIMVSAMLEVEALDHALQAAQLVTLGGPYLPPLQRVALAMARAGRTSEAFELVAQGIAELFEVPVPGRAAMAYALCDVAEALETKGAAAVTTAAARHMAKGVLDDDDLNESQLSILVRVVEAQTNSGDIPAANQTLEEIGSTHLIQLYSEFLTAWKRLGSADQQQALLKEFISRMTPYDIAEAGYRAQALGHLSVALASSEQFEDAINASDSAKNFALLAQYSTYHNDALLAALRAYARNGHFDFSEHLVGGLIGAVEQMKAFTEIAYIAADLGENQRAERLAGHVLSFLERGDLGLLGHMREAGQVIYDADDLLRAAGEKGLHRVNLLFKITEVFLNIGDKTSATQVKSLAYEAMESVTLKPWVKVELLCSMAEAAHRAKLDEQAAATLEEALAEAQKAGGLGEPDRPDDLARVAAALFQLERHDEALRVWWEALGRARRYDCRRVLHTVGLGAKLLAGCGFGGDLDRMHQVVGELISWWSFR